MTPIDYQAILRRESDPAWRKALKDAYDQIPQAVLEDLLAFVRPDESSFRTEDAHGRYAAYVEGQRSVIYHINKRREEIPSLAPIISEQETP